MFTKILIANRGEIACRVMETARRLGVQAVAVYSDSDAGAKHVAIADQAVHIGGAGPADSYLRGDVIIQAAKDIDAEAIHPGYGFLSENPDFVEACEAAGITFIGPSAKAIRAMGLKDAAKKLMIDAGVPVVPGYHGQDQDPALLKAEATKIGYPVLIKAVAGGGGKGMRLVEAESDFDAALASAMGEAKTAFGNDAVLIEKFITSPRHIEVQVFGDGTKAVHLFERDCSLQRRHQKVIEEAPAPGMTDAARAAMGQAGVRAAEAIGYAGAGTVEFIVDGSGPLREDGFWFMEMNTRLQVEHPVTEAITGVDLVEWQLRVASGEALPQGRDELTINGHSFEARLYAEDVPAGFLPATGTLTHLQFPDHVRADSGVRAGDEISPWYDPMIAKIITHGETRDIALAKMAQALAETQVAGCTTNLAFLRALCRHEDFARGDVDTGLIDRDLEALTPDPVPCKRAQSLAALGFAGLTGMNPHETGFCLWTSAPVTVQFLHKDEAITARIGVLGPDRFDVEVDEHITQVHRLGSVWWVDGNKTPAEIVVLGEDVSVFWGNNYHFAGIDPLNVGSVSGGDASLIDAPMPGLVKTVSVAAGDAVKEGDTLAVLEAMKMEHTLTAARDGVIEDVLCKGGDQVAAGAALIRLADENGRET